MPKTQEELNQLKQEVEQLNEKLKELTEEELNVVTGGIVSISPPLRIEVELLNYDSGVGPGAQNK